MITTTFATWTLLVRLISPTYPQEHQLWDMNYSKIQSQPECIEMAKSQWSNYYYRYNQWMTSMMTFDTLCVATTPKTEYFARVTCERNRPCDVKAGSTKR